jgi:hypothetical protein
MKFQVTNDKGNAESPTDIPYRRPKNRNILN